MTPEEYKEIEPELLAVINRIIGKFASEAYRQGLEDGAKIAETRYANDSGDDSEEMRCGLDIASAIRAAKR